MSLNKNAIKRLAQIVGIDRINKNIVVMLNETGQNYLTTIIKKLILIVDYIQHKTITINELQFLSIIQPQETPCSLCPNNLSHLVQTDVNTQYKRKPNNCYILVTLKRPFKNNLKNILSLLNRTDIKLGKEFILIFQSLYEQFIMKLLAIAYTYSRQCRRETLSKEDLKTTLVTLKMI